MNGFLRILDGSRENGGLNGLNAEEFEAQKRLLSESKAIVLTLEFLYIITVMHNFR